MKKVALIILAVVAFFSAWHIYSKSVQNRRESAYREALAPLQHDLHSGMTRTQVQAYLESRKLTYAPIFWDGSGGAWSYAIKIGKEPGSFPCDSWTVYVALDFNPSEMGRPELNVLPADTLRETKIKKVGHCL